MRRRIVENVERRSLVVSRSRVWLRIVGMPVDHAAVLGPRPTRLPVHADETVRLRYDVCRKSGDVGRLAATTLKAFGGIRRWQRIAHELGENYRRLEQGLWTELLQRFKQMTVEEKQSARA